MTALANEHQAINLAQGFPNFNPPQELIEYFYEGLKNGMNQYAPMPGYLPLRQQISKRLLHRYNKIIDPEKEITITTGATQAIEKLIEVAKGPTTDYNKIRYIAPEVHTEESSRAVMAVAPKYVDRKG